MLICMCIFLLEETVSFLMVKSVYCSEWVPKMVPNSWNEICFLLSEHFGVNICLQHALELRAIYFGIYLMNVMLKLEYLQLCLPNIFVWFYLFSFHFGTSSLFMYLPYIFYWYFFHLPVRVKPRFTYGIKVNTVLNNKMREVEESLIFGFFLCFSNMLSY